MHVRTMKRKALIGITRNLAQLQSSTVCRSLLILGSKGQGSGSQGPLVCVFSDCRRTHDEEPQPAYILADEQRGLGRLKLAQRQVHWHRFASPQSTTEVQILNDCSYSTVVNLLLCRCVVFIQWSVCCNFPSKKPQHNSNVFTTQQHHNNVHNHINTMTTQLIKRCELLCCCFVVIALLLLYWIVGTYGHITSCGTWRGPAEKGLVHMQQLSSSSSFIMTKLCPLSYH